MGYDVELIQIAVPGNTKFPVDAPTAKKLRPKAGKFGDPQVVKDALSAIKGCRPGPAGAVDYMGRGLSYARFTVKEAAIHVENNCSGKELLSVYDVLRKTWPDVLIYDLQSEQLHNGKSFFEWWSKPL